MTFEAAQRAGISRSSWYRLLDRGLLDAIHPRVARLVGRATTREQTILAAILSIRQVSAPPGLVLASHRSAAHLLGLERPDGDPVDVIVTGGSSRNLNGVVVHRPTDLDDLVPTTRRGIPCTNELRTLVDLGAVDPAAVPAALDRFATTWHLTPVVVAALVDRHARHGRSGVRSLRAAFAAWPLADQVPDSELELAMARLLRDHGLPAATFHACVAGFEVDFLIDGSPVVVECDGWTYHVADRGQWEYDLDRDAALSAAASWFVGRAGRSCASRPTRPSASARCWNVGRPTCSVRESADGRSPSDSSHLPGLIRRRSASPVTFGFPGWCWTGCHTGTA